VSEGSTQAGTRRRRGRPRIAASVQRRRLLDGALRAFRDRAYESTTVSDIVREAGMSSRSFYEHFASKEDLVVELVHEAGRELLRDIERVLAETEDPGERLERGMRAFLDTFANTPVDLSRLGDTAPLRVMGARRRYVMRIAEIVVREGRRAYEQGAIEREPDPLDVEVLVMGFEALASRWVAEGRAQELGRLHPPLLDLALRTWF
jgi:AcrR family transcriptional regulator